MTARRELLSKSCLFQSLQIRAISKLFGNDEYWLYFFFAPNKPELRLPPAEILAEAACFSHGERVLVQIALEIWCEQGDAKIGDLLDILDEESFLRCLGAFLDYRELSVRDLQPHSREGDYES